MMQKFAIAVVCGFLALTVLGADSTASTIAPALNEWSGDVSKIQSAEPDAPGAWEATGRAQFFSKVTLPVNPSKGYRLAGSFRVPEGVLPQNLYFGIVMYDETGEIIKPQWVFAVNGTLTRLTTPAKIGDRSIQIADASNWKTGPLYVVAFQADPDGKNTDLPNRRISASITTMTADGAGTRIELAQPLTADYPEGTSVRMHLISAPFLYVGANNKTLTGQWQELAGTVRGYRLWTGSKKIGIVIIVNATGDRSGVTQCRDLRLEETP